MAENSFRCGFVAIVGRPNVGKSTLVNALVGHKVSIVTAKPQTTRHRILGVLTRKAWQAVFVDTPGLHRKAAKAMNRLMNRAAVSALADADIVLFVTEALRWTGEDDDVLKRIRASGKPAIALLNKIDTVHPREQLLSAIDAMAKRHAFAEIIPASAWKGTSLQDIEAAIVEYLPPSPPLFPAEMTTDRSPEFQAAEIIREKLTVHLRQELPYGVTVQIERYDTGDDRVTIHAIVWVERESQKGIVVGRGGAQLKTVGREARMDIARQLGCPVHLELWVKVKANWADNELDLARLGYESPT